MAWIFLVIIAIISCLYAIIRSPSKALLNIYLSLLLFLPHIFAAKIPGLPAMTFSQAAIIPIFLVFVFSQLISINLKISGVVSKRYLLWRFSLMDVLVAAYMCSCVYSEYLNEGESMGTNLLANMLSNVFATYVLGKGLIQGSDLTISFAKRFVLIILITLIISSYEMIFIGNPFVIVFKDLFPEEIDKWPTLFRYGFVRIGGPFVQTIIFGMMIGIALLFQYWLWKNRLWKNNLFKSAIITCVLIFGMAMTFSRSPILSTFLGALFIGVGFSRHPWMSLAIRGTILFIFLWIILIFIIEVAQIHRLIAPTGEEATISYRAEMFSKYLEIGMKRPLWGWGIESWPKVSGMGSIDNHYLWLFVKHGIVPLIFFTITIIYDFGRLLFRGMKSLPNSFESSLAFMFLGILLSFSTAFTSVYMGLQLEPLFFLILGWIEAFLLSKSKAFQKVKPLIAPLIRRQALQIVHRFF